MRSRTRRRLPAVAKSKALEEAAQRVAEGIGPDSLLSMRERAQRQLDQQTQQIGAESPNLTGEIVKAAGKVGHAIGDIPSEAQSLATGTNTGQPQTAGGVAPGVVTPQFTTGVQQQVGGDVKAITESASPNQIFQMPSHIYRYLYDVRARRGSGAMIEAAIPLIGGMVGGYALTHSAQGAEDTLLAWRPTQPAGLADASTTPGENAASDSTGFEAGGKKPPASAATGLRAKAITNAVLSPGVAALKLPVQALSAASSSPSALLGEGATMISGHVIYPDSWDRTANATTWKLPNGRVGPTFGQTVANAIGVQHGSNPFNVISGSLDAFMGLAVPDPLGAAGRVYGKAKAGELGGFLGSHVSGISPRTPEQVEATVAQNAGVRSALKSMVGKSEAQIVSQFREFAGIAPQLANKNSLDEVTQVFMDAARTEELFTTSAMPTLHVYSRGKAVGSAVSDLGTPAPTAFDDLLQKFTGKNIPMNSPQAMVAVRDMLKASGESPGVVNNVVNAMAASRDPIHNIQIAKNAMKSLVGRKVIAALPKGHDVLGRSVLDAANSRIDEMMGGAGAGHTGLYGSDPAGADLSYVFTHAGDPEEKAYAAALWFSQADHKSVPSVRDTKQLIHSLANMEKWTSKNAMLSRGLQFEQFIDHTVNERFFQPLALARTGGWATRVSISEAIPNILRQDHSTSRLAASPPRRSSRTGRSRTQRRHTS